MQQTIDYCSQVLKFENVCTLELIALNHVTDVVVGKKLVDEPIAVSVFLKHGIVTHLDVDNEDVNDTPRALEGCHNGTSEQEKTTKRSAWNV